MRSYDLRQLHLEAPKYEPSTGHLEKNHVGKLVPQNFRFISVLFPNTQFMLR